MRGSAGALIALALSGMVAVVMRPADGPAVAGSHADGAAADSAAAVTVTVKVAFTIADAVTVRPADGARLARAPAEVAVSLPEGVVREAHLSVGDATGAPVTNGTAQTRGGELTVPVSIAKNGTYLVAYHFLLADGRVVANVTRFGVGEEVAGQPSMAHAHSDDPINLVLTGIAGISVVALLFVMVRRPRIPTG